MNNYEIKKVIPVEDSFTLGECSKILPFEGACLGVLNENSEIDRYVLKEDLERALEFDISNYQVRLIAIPAKIMDIYKQNLNEDQIKKHVTPGLNKGIFIGKDKKEISELIVYKALNPENKRVLLNEYEKNISVETRKALELCYKAADKNSIPIFLIGGIVRDIIIGQKNFDVDVTVEKNAIEFCRILKKEYPLLFKSEEIHEDFKTAKVSFSIDDQEIKLDIASTRQEIYPYPASLPQVSKIGCNIKEDISRRDFTINSMALSLNQDNFCTLVDPLNGYNDLKSQQIKVLHSLSFIDDPTRIIRALKFSVRFNFALEEVTASLQKSCLDSGLFDNLGGERIKSEIKQTFNLNQAKALERFIKEKIYLLVDKNISISESPESLSLDCQKIISDYQKFVSSKDLIWLIYMGALIANFSKDEINKISARLLLSRLETEILLGSKDLVSKINEIKSAQTRFDIYEQFENYFSESILIGLISIRDEDVKEKINLYLNELQYITIYTTGKTLIEAGLSPGPFFGETLRDLLKEKINQKISSKEDEIRYIEKIVAKKSKKHK
jgi:tRNA nucleotidyltransferase/poly(A) polymerase